MEQVYLYQWTFKINKPIKGKWSSLFRTSKKLLFYGTILLNEKSFPSTTNTAQKKEIWRGEGTVDYFKTICALSKVFQERIIILIHRHLGKLKKTYLGDHQLPINIQTWERYCAPMFEFPLHWSSNIRVQTLELYLFSNFL